MKIVGAVFKEKKNEFITLPDGWTVETTAGELGTTLTDEVGNLTIALNTQFLVLPSSFPSSVMCCWCRLELLLEKGH